MHTVFLGLSTNLGDKLQNLNSALTKLSEFAEIIDLSSIYLTEPVGFKDQDDFLNAVVKIQTKVSHTDLLERIKLIEKEMGRVKIIKDGPRTIDLDILYYQDLCFDSKNLTIPHPRLHLRNFVLTPLTEIAKDNLHPLLKLSSQQMLQNLENPDKVEFYATFN